MRRNTRFQKGVLGLAGAALLAALAGMMLPTRVNVRRYVDKDATSGANTGLNWTDAYTDLQSALTETGVVVDEVWVAEGIYLPTPGTDETVSFDLSDDIEVFGGFNGTETAGHQRDPAVNVTTLSGDIDNDGTLDAENSRHVVVAGNLSSPTVLDGFTITMGYADGTGLNSYGGGLWISQCDAVTVRNCRFENNYSAENVSRNGGGGGAFVYTDDNGPISSQITFEDCVFDANSTFERSGGLFYLSAQGATGHAITLLRTDFTNNFMTNPGPNIVGGGAGAQITGAETIIITDCNFIDNVATSYGALYLNSAGSNPVTSTATITDCTFDGNIAGINGGAIYIAHIDSTTTVLRGLFKDNQALKGGGAIWALVPRDGNMTVDLTDCDFLRNQMTTNEPNQGGGALFLSPVISGTGPNGVIKGTWTRCNFIQNQAFKGGGAYVTGTGLVELKDCKFISNHSRAGGGGMCVSDLSDLGTVDVRICNTDFISNTAVDKGGAVYNRAGSTTTMVNCIMAGNTANSLGGATCNADDGFVSMTTTTFNLHNCLLAGNLADLAGNQGGGHLNRDFAESNLINCTVVKNTAFANYGGIENGTDAGTMKVRNCIVWGNDGAAGNGGIDNQLHYTGNTFIPGDVDASVIEKCLGTCFPGGTNIGDGLGEDPSVVNPTAVTWNDCTFDPAAGTVTFDLTQELVAPLNETLFQPDPANSPLQLLISTVIVHQFCPDELVCFGWWPTPHPGIGTISGTLFDYHIAGGSSAVNFGDAAYLIDAADPCDLNGDMNTGEPLPRDLDITPLRNQGTNPDSGAYETAGM